jgi:Sugar (and other) transporter
LACRECHGVCLKLFLLEKKKEEKERNSLTYTVYPTEINSLTMRTKGAAIGAATNWILNFMVVEITPIGIQSLRWRFYIIWIVLNAAMVPTMYLFYPETAGRTLEDMDEYYRTDPPLLVFRDKEAISTKRPERFRVIEEEDIMKDAIQRGEEALNEKDDQPAHHSGLGCSNYVLE